MKDKIRIYFEQKIKIHIDCYNGRYYNGEVIEFNPDKGFIILKDRVLGEMPIMFEDIQNIEKYKERDEE